MPPLAESADGLAFEHAPNAMSVASVVIPSEARA
jgi:hypothetical protein